MSKDKRQERLQKFKPPHWVLIIVLVLIVLGFLISIINYKLPTFTLFVFIIAGVLVGYYYGYYNLRIFHKPFEDNVYLKEPKVPTEKIIEKYNSEGNLIEKIIERNKINRINQYDLSSINDVAIVNSIWVHVVCGLVGAAALYLLSNHICLLDPRVTIYRLGWPDLFLFLIAVLGYTGLLPRTLWFFASKGNLNLANN